MITGTGLGWKDVFSNHNYTLRQQQYVQALHAESVYTPQAVVQGQFEMVGSNRSGILNAVKVARTKSDNIDFDATASVSNHSVVITYGLNQSAPSNITITSVLVQNHSSTSVSRGENSGRQLADYHIARSTASMPLTKKQWQFTTIITG